MRGTLHRLQVFSLAGEHRRSITGEWKRPAALCFVKDRLYLVEAADDVMDEEGELINPLLGRRIFVLSLQGDTLQVYTHPVVPAPGPFLDPLTFWDLCYLTASCWHPSEMSLRLLGYWPSVGVSYASMPRPLA